MKKMIKPWFLSIVLVAIIPSSYSFNITAFESEEYAIMCHSDDMRSSDSYLIVIPRSDIDFHLSHGDIERPYSVELHKAIIESEEDGAGIACTK